MYSGRINGTVVGQSFRSGSARGQLGDYCSIYDFNKRSGVSISYPEVDHFGTAALIIKGLHLSGRGIKVDQ